jgi:hypothetical protein
LMGSVRVCKREGEREREKATGRGRKGGEREGTVREGGRERKTASRL